MDVSYLDFSYFLSPDLAEPIQQEVNHTRLNEIPH